MGPQSLTSVRPVVGVAAPPVFFARPGPSASQNLCSRIGFFFLAPFIVFLFSRLLDVTVPFLHLPFVFGGATVAAAFLSGELVPVLRMTAVRCILLFTGWFCLASVFGLWKGGSFAMFRNYWVKSLLIFLALACLAVTLQRIRVIIYLIALGIALAMLVALVAGATDAENRLIMPVGELANSNALGIFAVLGLPLCWHSVMFSIRGWLAALLSAVLSLPMLYVVSRSGSRTALVMLGVLFLYGMCRFDWRQRILLAGIMAPLALVAFMTAPEALLSRYATLFVTNSRQLDEQDTELDASAVGSTEARLYLLEKSLSITFRNPLFGIGPGNFMVAENELAEKEGRRGNWHVTHNGYTEISAETGLIGFLLYTAALVSIWRALGNISARAAGVTGAGETRQTASVLRMLFFISAIGVFFGISLYQYFIPAFMGLALGVVRFATAGVEPATAGLQPRGT